MKKHYIVLLGAVLAFISRPGLTERMIDAEHIKSAMIYQLMNFVKVEEKPNIWQICLVDTRDMKQAMEQIWDKQYLVSRVVPASTFPVGFQDCHAIYYGGKEEREARKYIKHSHDNRILSIGSTNSFIDQGGHIGFVTHKGEVRIEVNLKSLRTAGLDINSSVLQSAVRVVK